MLEKYSRRRSLTSGIPVPVVLGKAHSKSMLSINFFSVADLEDDHRDDPVFDHEDDPVIPLPNTMLLRAGQCLRDGSARGVGLNPEGSEPVAGG